MCEERKNIVFFHNTIPEYRIGLFKNLEQFSFITFVISDKKLSNQIYGFDYDASIEKNSIDYIDFSKSTLKTIIKKCHEADSIVVQPPDSIKEIILAYFEFAIAKAQMKKTAIFWERWNTIAPIKRKKYKIKFNVHDFLVRPLVKHIDIFLVSGKMAKKYLMHLGVEQEKIQIVGDATTLPESQKTNIREMYNIPSDAFLFLFLGRLVPIKGAEVLIRAFNLLKKECYLLIAGTGECEKQLKVLAEGNRNIKFAGYVDPSKRADYFCAANCFVLPSIVLKGSSDAWGLTLNEALSCGKPIISTDAVGGAYDLIIPDTGVMVENNNVNQLAKALDKVMNTKYDSNQIKEFSKNFTADSMAKKIVGVL